ncbi:MAG: transposase, partial [bacterium]|nr:transposase [bacterium]
RLSKLLAVDTIHREQTLATLEEGGNVIVDITAFCLMPNHFHILLRQVKDNGISRFAKLISDSYTKFFNTAHERVGPLFQGQFKAVHIETEDQLLHLSRYIHLNPLISSIVREKDFLNYPWSSLSYFVGHKACPRFLDPAPVMSQFKTSKKYLELVLDQVEYARRLKNINHLTLEKYPDVR